MVTRNLYSQLAIYSLLLAMPQMAFAQQAPLKAFTYDEPAMPDNPQCFAFTDALEEAYESDPRIEGARAEREQATANYMASVSQRLPQVSIFAQATEGQEGLLNNRSDRNQAGLQISQSLYNFGAGKLAEVGAKTDVIATQYNLEQVSATAAEEAGSAYLELLRANANLALAREQEAYYLEDAQSVDERLTAKAITIADASQIKASYALAVNQRIESILARDSARRRLETITGYPVTCTSVDSAQGYFRTTKSILDDETLDSLLNFSFENAAGIRSAEARLKSANTFTEEVKRRALPSVSLSGFVAYDRTDNAAPGTNEWNDINRVSLNVSGQLYTGGLGRARNLDAKSRQRTAKSNLATSRRQVEDRVTRAWVRMQAQETALSALSDARRNLKTQLDNIKAENKAGTKSVTQTVQAAEAYYTAASQEINMQYQYYNSLLVLRSTAFGLAADNPF
ncbi:MAG: TolC family protein [bacterium]